MNIIDRKLWLQQKQKRCAHFKKRKLPEKFLSYWRIERKLTDEMLSGLNGLRSKLLHIEERFVIEPDIWINYYSYEDILGQIELLECSYEIILSPVEDENFRKSFSLFLFRNSCLSPMLNLHSLLESVDGDLWEILLENAPPLDASAKVNVEWFMRQSRGIKLCLDQFYRARSYPKSYGYLVAVFSFMENIYHLIHRLHIGEISGSNRQTV